MSATVPAFAKTFARAWTAYIDNSDHTNATSDPCFASEDELVSAIYRAHAEGKDVSLALDCLIGQARSERVRLGRMLLDHYLNGQNIIDGEWEEVK